MCFSKIFDLSDFPKCVLKSDRSLRCDDDDDENDDFQWFLNLNRSLKTRLGGVRFVVSHF